MRPTVHWARRASVLPLLVLMLSACASTSSNSPAATPRPPIEIPPPAVLDSAQSVTAWQNYSQKAQAWLQKLSNEAMNWR